MWLGQMIKAPNLLVVTLACSLFTLVSYVVILLSFLTFSKLNVALYNVIGREQADFFKVVIFSYIIGKKLSNKKKRFSLKNNKHFKINSMLFFLTVYFDATNFIHLFITILIAFKKVVETSNFKLVVRPLSISAEQ